MIVPKFNDERLSRIGNILLSNEEKYGEIFLVGGYIRDCLLEKQSHDLDFSIKQNAALAAKSIADSFGGDFYILDRQRETARAIIKINNSRMVIDVALIAGQTIFDDLAKRDFTINAIAANLRDPINIIDPLKGVLDLSRNVLRPCSNTSFIDDPVRVLRAVRFVRELCLSVEDSNKKLIKQSANKITQVSGERIRDALCQIFNIDEVGTSLQLLIDLGIFKELFPELLPLQSISALTPHVHNVFSHSLQVASQTHEIIKSIYSQTWRNDSAPFQDIKDLTTRYKEELSQYFENITVESDMILPLMVVASLYHDSGKMKVNPEIKNKRIFYPDYAVKGVSIAREKMKAFAFSNEEISLVSSVIKNHMDAGLKNSNDEVPSRAIHRFYKKSGNAGVLTVFLHLADLLSTYENRMPALRWNTALRSAENLLDGWLTQYNEVVSPPSLIDGNDLMIIFGLPPGKEIGEILDQIKEEQAAGAIVDRQSAIKFVEENLGRKQ